MIFCVGSHWGHPNRGLPWARRLSATEPLGQKAAGCLFVVLPVAGATNPSAKGDLSGRRAVGRWWALRAAQRKWVASCDQRLQWGGGDLESRVREALTHPHAWGSWEFWAAVSGGRHLL